MSIDADTRTLNCGDGVGLVEVDLGDLAEAIMYWRRGDKRETLHRLENAFGRDFLGLGELRPEDLR